ncbi:hypothetical protein OTU49_003202, partial [Cherax quadricarinatus]
MRGFLVLLLVSFSRGSSIDRHRRELLGNLNALESSLDGYLPPAPPTPKPCQPSTIYNTKVQYSTVVIPSTVYNTNVQYVTQTDVRTNPVYTTIFSEIIRTQVVPSVQYKTVIITQTKENYRTQVITLPPQVYYVTKTQQDVRTQVQYQTVYTTRIQQVPTTIVRNVVSTLVVPQQVVSTIYKTQYVTRTQQLPGQTRTIYNTQYSTIYSTVVIPAQDVVKTTEVVRTNVVVQTITQPGQTQVIYSTVVVPVTTTIYTEVVIP